jgi:hypothetical protein
MQFPLQTGGIKMLNVSTFHCGLPVLILQNNKKPKWNKFWRFGAYMVEG